MYLGKRALRERNAHPFPIELPKGDQPRSAACWLKCPSNWECCGISSVEAAPVRHARRRHYCNRHAIIGEKSSHLNTYDGKLLSSDVEHIAQTTKLTNRWNKFVLATARKRCPVTSVSRARTMLTKGPSDVVDSDPN